MRDDSRPSTHPSRRSPRRAALLSLAGSLLVTLPVLLAVAGAGSRAEPSDWPQFRGPRRDGVSAETGLLQSWPPEGPRVLWRAPLGEGYSGISVVGGRLFTMYSDGDAEYVVAVGAATGETLWRYRLDAAYRDSQGNGPRSTPTVAEGLVYALGAKGRLAALEASSGRELWSQDLKQTLDARAPKWGVSTSPLLEGDFLIVDAGGRPNASVVALDRRTGKKVWSAGSDKAGYSAPVALEIGGLRQVLVFTGTRLVSVAPRNGALLAQIPWKTSYDVNAATPVFVPPDKIFVASGYGTGGALLRVQRSGESASFDELWRSRGMKNQFSSSIYHRGHLYGFDNATLKCLDARNGEERWAVREGLGHGSLTLADGRLYLLGDRGKLVLAEATPEAYREHGRVQLFRGKTWTVPTISGGRLYARDEHELVALNVTR